MAVLEQDERDTLQSVDTSLRQIQRSLEDAARSGAIDRQTLDRITATARRAAQRVNKSLPPQLDDRAAAEIKDRLIAILTLEIGEDLSSLDVADRFLMEMEAVRHIVRDVLDEQPPIELRDPKNVVIGFAGTPIVAYSAPIELRDPKNVVILLESWLPGVSVSKLAEILGVSERALQRRRNGGGGEATHRMGIVARLVAVLRHSWTDAGVAAWFYRPLTALDGRAPIELLDDAGRERELLLAARAGRVQGGV